jgi:hypothetical protein
MRRWSGLMDQRGRHGGSDRARVRMRSPCWTRRRIWLFRAFRCLEVHAGKARVDVGCGCAYPCFDQRHGGVAAVAQARISLEAYGSLVRGRVFARQANQNSHAECASKSWGIVVGKCGVGLSGRWERAVSCARSFPSGMRWGWQVCRRVR